MTSSLAASIAIELNPRSNSQSLCLIAAARFKAECFACFETSASSAVAVAHEAPELVLSRPTLLVRQCYHGNDVSSKLVARRPFVGMQSLVRRRLPSSCQLRQQSRPLQTPLPDSNECPFRVILYRCRICHDIVWHPLKCTICVAHVGRRTSEM